jgi:pilus assembly protein CpaF
MVDARLPDGSRINAIIPPLSLSGPLVTIRKFGRNRLSTEDMVRLGTLSAQAAEFLDICLQAELNILISGGTGTGKTTLLNALSASISDDERIVSIEDAAELQLKQRHVLRLESRPSNIEGEGAVTIRELVRNSLRMRPDRIIVGEVRGPETLDMLQAMNTGHEGSLATVHANSAEDAIVRLETLASMSDVGIPFEALRDQINGAVSVIVQLDRGADGRRRLVEIAAVASARRDTFRLKTVARFDAEPISADRVVRGEFRHYRLPEALAHRLLLAGSEVPPEFSVAADSDVAPEREAA